MSFSIFGKGLIRQLDFSLIPQTGIVTTEFKEKAFVECDSETRLLSLLDWDIKCAPCISLDSSIIFNDYFAVNISGNYVLPFSKGSLQDYDWENWEYTGTGEQTKYSWHENKIVDMYDFEASFGVRPIITNNLILESDFIYSYSYYSFASTNGYKQYAEINDDGSAYEPWNKNIPKISMEGRIIDYKSYTNAFGLGSKITYSPFDKFSLCGNLNFFISFDSKALDNHVKRNILVLYDNQGKFCFSGIFSSAYKITKNYYIYAKTKFLYTDKHSSVMSSPLYKCGGESSCTMYATIGCAFNYKK